MISDTPDPTLEELLETARADGLSVVTAKHAADDATTTYQDRRRRLTDVLGRISAHTGGTIPLDYPGVGHVDYYPPAGESVVIVSHRDFREHLAQHHPAGVRAVIDVHPSVLGRALELLAGDGISAEAELVDVAHAQQAYMRSLEVIESVSDDGKREFDFVHVTDDGEAIGVPGLGMARGKAARLVVRVTGEEARS